VNRYGPYDLRYVMDVEPSTLDGRNPLAERTLHLIAIKRFVERCAVFRQQ
jgi:hypothetical protein